MTTTLDARTRRRLGPTALLLALGITVGLIAGRLGWQPATAEAQPAELGNEDLIHVYPAGAGTRAIIIDGDGFAWTIDCGSRVSSELRGVPSGQRVIDGQPQWVYRNLRTGRDHLLRDGRYIPIDE
jgi:hypothetical protein